MLTIPRGRNKQIWKTWHSKVAKLPCRSTQHAGKLPQGCRETLGLSAPVSQFSKDEAWPRVADYI